MSQSGGGQLPHSAWQTATSNRPRNSQSASRTPQNRSNTASPSQQGPPSQPPKTNPWGAPNRSSTPNGPPQQQQQLDTQHEPVNGFNAADAKAFLAKGVSQGQSYKVNDTAGTSAGRSGGGGAWGAKPNTMANGQPFFVQLAKQVATTEGGG